MESKKLVKNYIYNTIYQILLLIVPFITTPYISRVLGVTNIGIFQYVHSNTSYFVLIGVVGTSLYGQREIAYLQDNVIERTKAFWEIELFRLISSSVFLIIFYCLFCIKSGYTLIYTICSLEIMSAAIDISWFYMGLENFKTIVLRNIVIKVLSVISIFIFVKSEEDLLIYTICMVVPTIIGNFSLWFNLKNDLGKKVFQLGNTIQGIKKRLPLIIQMFLPQIAMDVYLVLNKTMLGIFSHSMDQVGYFSQAEKIVKIVLTLVSSLGTVMLPSMAAAYSRGDTEKITNTIKSVFKFMYSLSFPLLFGLCAITPTFIPVFLGDGYDTVVSLIVIMSPIIVIIATSNVIGRQYLLPTNQQRAFTWSIVFGAVVNFISNLLLIPTLEALGATISTVLAELSVTIVQCYVAKDNLPLKKCILSGIRYLLFSIPMYIVVKIVILYIPGTSLIKIAIGIFAGIISYFVELMVSKDPVMQEMVVIVRKGKQ